MELWFQCRLSDQRRMPEQDWGRLPTTRGWMRRSGRSAACLGRRLGPLLARLCEPVLLCARQRSRVGAPFAAPVVAQSFLGMPACFNTALAVWRDKMV